MASKFGGIAPPQETKQPFMNDVLAVAGEFSAAANRSMTDTVDFLITDTANALLSVGGSGYRVPSLTESLTPYGIQGGYMEEGLAREMVRGAGSIAPIALGTGQVIRQAAQKLPAFLPSESIAAGVTRQMGKVSPIDDIAFGALAGAGAAAGNEYGGEIGSMVGGIAAPIAGGLAKGVVSAVSRFGGAPLSRAMTEEQAALITSAEREGIPLYTSDVLPPKTFAGRMGQQIPEKIPFAGTGGARSGQQTLREEAVDSTVQRYAEHSYEEIVRSIKAQSSRVKNAAGNVLESAGIKLNQFGEIDTSSTRAAINTAKSGLSKSNVIESSGSAVDDLVKLSDTLSKPQTFTTLKENRTAFWDIVNSVDPAQRSQMTSRAKSLMRDVYNAMSSDMEKFARENLSPSELIKWQKANSVWANEARNLTKSKLKNVLDKGDVTPESVKGMLFSQNKSEVDLLYRSLTPTGKVNARAAIISKVANDLSKRSAGITPNSFKNEMKKYKMHVDAFFKGDEKTRLNGLLAVLEATTRAQNAALVTPTGQQALGAGTGVMFWNFPTSTAVAGGTVGLLGRVYETRAVRNALLRLGSSRKGSDNYTQALMDSQFALQAAAQDESSKTQNTK